jgi:CheY-like chemotaxis protein
MRRMSVKETTRSPAAVEILVIDDDRVIREVLAELLASVGYGVTVAGGGIEGLRRFVDGRFDVIVTDVCMPGLDGWEVARRLRDVSSDVGIIVMSASLDHRDRVRAEDGRLAMLAKPFTLEELTAAIDRLTTVPHAA